MEKRKLEYLSKHLKKVKYTPDRDSFFGMDYSLHSFETLWGKSGPKLKLRKTTEQNAWEPKSRKLMG